MISKLVANAGVDIIEVGFPSANPSNDGQVIRDAHKKVDMSIQDDWVYWRNSQCNECSSLDYGISI